MALREAFSDLTKKVMSLFEEFIQTKAQYLALDKEVHRMMESIQRDADNQKKHINDHEHLLHIEIADLTRRITMLEAKVETNIEKALLIVTKEGVKEGVREALTTQYAPIVNDLKRRISVVEIEINKDIEARSLLLENKEMRNDHVHTHIVPADPTTKTVG